MTRDEGAGTGAAADAGRGAAARGGAAGAERGRDRGAGTEPGRDPGAARERRQDPGAGAESGRDRGAARARRQDPGAGAEPGRDRGAARARRQDPGAGTESGRDRGAGAGDGVGPGPGSDAVAAVFAALADPTRRRILDALAAHGEATATALAAELPVSRQAIVKHLGVLDRAGLVAGHREGREARYRVIPERLGVTARWMDRVAAAWDTRLSAIKRLAEGE